MKKILKRNFYLRNTLVVAKDLLGKFIVRKTGKTEIAGMIVEVEAYNGPSDLASHASRGQTDRNAVMFGPSGHAYVYMIYGMYFCFNIVTEADGYPAAVLVRAVEPALQENKKAKKQENKLTTNGPGKFCRVFKIDKKLSGINVTRPGKLWLEDRGIAVKKSRIVSAKRIGVDYASGYKDKLWRFYMKDNGWVSKK